MNLLVQKPTNNKNKRKLIIDESFCRRSGRIALISKGFKDKSAVEAASKNDGSQTIAQNTQQSNKKLKKAVSINLGP